MHLLSNQFDGIGPSENYIVYAANGKRASLIENINKEHMLQTCL